MLKRVTIVLAVLLAVAISAAFVVHRWGISLERTKDEIHEATESQDETTTEKKKKNNSKEEKTSEAETEHGTVPMPEYEPSLSFYETEAFTVKQIKRKFNSQSDRIRRYRNFFNENYNEAEADVFLFDITHNGECDMIIVTPLKEGKKTVGAIVQLFTLVNGNTVLEIFRDFGGFTATGGSFCCYVTEGPFGDALLISKDDLIQGSGRLSYSIFSVLEDGTVMNTKQRQFIATEEEDLANEQQLSEYAAELEEDIAAAHTTIVDYRAPYAVNSKASDVLK